MLDPSLSPQQRRRQTRVVKYGAPALNWVLMAAVLVAMLLTAGPWISYPVTPIVWGAVVAAWMVATAGEPGVQPGGWLVNVVFRRYAPARYRRVLPGPRPQVTELHEALLDQARQGRLGALPVHAEDTESLLGVLWSAVTNPPPLRVREVTASVVAGAPERRTPDEQAPPAQVSLSSSTRLQRRRARHEAAHAVVAAALGARVVTVTAHGEHGNRCSYAQLPGDTVCERAWTNLVISMAGNVADLEHGHHDQGARDDIQVALQEAATILSCAQTPQAVQGSGPLTTDVLVTAAAAHARAILAGQVEDVRAVAIRLLAHPARTLPGDQFPELQALSIASPVR